MKSAGNRICSEKKHGRPTFSLHIRDFHFHFGINIVLLYNPIELNIESHTPQHLMWREDGELPY